MLAELVKEVASAARPWSDMYSDSRALQTGMAFLHLGGLLAAAGFALAADRATLRARRWPPTERRRLLAELEATHRPVLLGLTVVILTGAAMALADAQNLLLSPVFWLKMSAFVLLLGNGALLKRAGERLRVAAVEQEGRRWRALTHAALRSVALWTLTLFLGTLLTSAS